MPCVFSDFVCLLEGGRDEGFDNACLFRPRVSFGRRGLLLRRGADQSGFCCLVYASRCSACVLRPHSACSKRAPRELHMKSMNVTGYGVCLLVTSCAFWRRRRRRGRRKKRRRRRRCGCRLLFSDFLCQFGVKVFVPLPVSAASLHQHDRGDNRCNCRQSQPTPH